MINPSRFAALVLMVASMVPVAPAQTVATQEASASGAAGQPFAQLDQMLSSAAEQLLQHADRAAAPAQPAPAQTASQVRQGLSAPQAQPPGRAAIPPPEQAVAPRPAVERVRRLEPVIEPILRQEGVPDAMMAVVLVESGGQPDALSPKGARGLWQLMPETARRYGLAVTPERDERLDVPRATRAAARYLHDLRAEFGNWSAALAAYNAGERAVHNLLERTGGNDFQALSRSPQLPQETRNYVPAVLSAMRWFGGAPTFAAPLFKSSPYDGARYDTSQVGARQPSAPAHILYALYAADSR
jgi:soluble lytic murein transglycosylase-like protein